MLLISVNRVRRAGRREVVRLDSAQGMLISWAVILLMTQWNLSHIQRVRAVEMELLVTMSMLFHHRLRHDVLIPSG